MIKQLLIGIPLSLGVTAIPVHASGSFMTVLPAAVSQPAQSELLSTRSLDLGNRYANAYVSNIFKDNILLNLAYLSGRVQKADQVYWDNIRKPLKHEFILKPGEVFAYHDNIAPEFRSKVVRTTNSHFNAQEGYLSSGLLYGDGVCHLASLINWAATDAGLKVVAPVNHNFAAIPGIEAKYGTAIYYDPTTPEINQAQNLYVENTFNTPVRIVFDYEGDNLTVSIYK